MKQRLQRILSILCVLALAAGCMVFAAAAESVEDITRVVVAEWDDENNFEGLRPAAVTLTIGGKSVVLNEAGGWTGVTQAPADAEWAIPAQEGYFISSSGKEVTTVKYYHDIKRTDVSASVKWADNDNAAGLRPDEVRISLLEGGQIFRAPVSVTAGKDWAASWEKLPANKEGSTTPAVYSVAPASVPEGYTAAINGTEIIFTLKTATLSLTASAQAPEGVDAGALQLVVTGPDPKMPLNLTLSQVNGTYNIGEVLPGSYVVQETNADTLAEGYVLDAAASKVGDAVYAAAGEAAALNFRYVWKAPEEAEENTDPMAEVGSLTFQILGPDSRLPMTVTYSQFTDGKFQLDNLVPGDYAVIETNAEGLVKAYSLKSDSVTGMTLAVAANGTATASLYNHYTPAPTPAPEAEFIDIPVVKIWVDNDNRDLNRPESVTVQLFADGVEVDSHEVTAADGWRYTFTEKPRYRDSGEEIVYSINEKEVPMYKASVSGYTVTNTYNPELTLSTVTKIWGDDGPNDPRRPESLVVTLLPLNEVHLLTAANGWSFTRTDLPTVINGEPVVYSWTEQQVFRYASQAPMVEGNVTTFTNYIPAVPNPPDDGKEKPKTHGDTTEEIPEYDTPLGGMLLINHVGDCFD